MNPFLPSSIGLIRSGSLSWMLAVGALLVTGSALSAPVTVTVSDEAGKPIPQAVVFLESPAAKAATQPLKGVEVEQINREFRPAVSVVPTGTAIDFPNRDTIRHHVYSFSEAKRFDIKLYIGRPANPVVFDKAGIAVLGCNIHDNMAAWVVVVDTPYYGRTDSRGQVLIDAPAGTYRLRAWHTGLPPGAPAAEQAITVGADGARASIKLKEFVR